MDKTDRKIITNDINVKTDDLVSKMPYYAKGYFTQLEQDLFSPLTRQQYAFDMLRFFEWLTTDKHSAFKNKKINGLPASDLFDKLTKDDIQEYKTYLSETCDSLALSRKISCLRGFINYLYKEELIKNALHEHITLPKQPKADPQESIKNVLTSEQVKRILDAVEDTTGMNDIAKGKHDKTVLRDKAIMYVLLGTGIRVQELVNINVDEIKWEESSIPILRKGTKPDIVYINPEIETALHDYIDNGREQLFRDTRKHKEPKRNETTDLDKKALFISLHHKRLTVRAVETLIDNYAKKAGINVKVTPHSLRRTFGTNVYNATSDIYLTASALGHSSVETTKKHYAKMDDEHKRIAAETSSSWLKK